MKSKLIKYPYAKPQYHWDRTGFDTDVTYNWDYTVDTTEKDIPIKNARQVYRQNGDVTIGLYPTREYKKYGEIPKDQIQNPELPKEHYLDLYEPIGRQLDKLGLYITYDKYLHQGTCTRTIEPGEECYRFKVSRYQPGLNQKAVVNTFEDHFVLTNIYPHVGPYSSSIGFISKDITGLDRSYYINLAEFIEELTDTPKQFTINYYDKELHYVLNDGIEYYALKLMGQTTVYAHMTKDGPSLYPDPDNNPDNKYDLITMTERSGNYGVIPDYYYEEHGPVLENFQWVYSKDINKIQEDIENTIWDLVTDVVGEGSSKGYQSNYKEYWTLTHKQLTDSIYLYKMEFTSTDEKLRRKVASRMQLINYYPVCIYHETATERQVDYCYPVKWDAERTLIGTNMPGSLHYWDEDTEIGHIIVGISGDLYSGPDRIPEDRMLVNEKSTIYSHYNHFKILENNKFEQYEYNNIQVHFTDPHKEIIEYTEDSINVPFPELAHLTAEELRGYLFLHYDYWDGGYRPNIVSFTDGVATINNYYKNQEIGITYHDVLNKWNFIAVGAKHDGIYGSIYWEIKNIDNYEKFDNTYTKNFTDQYHLDTIFIGYNEPSEIPDSKEYEIYHRDHTSIYLSDIVFTCSWAEAYEFIKKHKTGPIQYDVVYKTTNGEVLGDNISPDAIPDRDAVDFKKTMYYLYTAPESNTAKVSDVYKTAFDSAELEALENCTYDNDYAYSESNVYKIYKYRDMNPKDTYEITSFASGSVSSKDPNAYPLNGTIGLYTYKYSHNEFNGYIRNNIIFDVVMNEDKNFLPKTEVINQQLYVWMMKEMVDGSLVDLYKVYSARRHTYPDNGEYEGKYYEFLPEDSTGDGTDSYVQVYRDLWNGEAIADIIPAAEEVDSSLIWRNPIYDKIINNTASINYDTIAAGSLEIDTRLTLAQANSWIGSMFIYMVDFQNSGDWVNKGFFWIDGVENAGPAHVKIYAHDQVYKLNKYVDDWIGTLTYPMTLSSYYHALLDYCDINYDEQEDNILNGDFPIYNNFTAVKLTATELMKYITELAGGYFHTDRYNKAHISSYTPNPKVYDYGEYNYLNYSSFNSDLFNEFKFIRNNKIYYDKKIEPENEPKVIFIKDNPLVGNDNSTTQIDAVVDNIYNQTSTQLANYRNGTIKFFADFGVKIGDIIGIMAYDETQEAPMSFIKMAIMSEHIDDNGITYESYGELEYPIESDGTRTSITYTDAINLEDTNKQVNTNSANISTMEQSMNTLINNLEDTNKQVNTNSTNISTMAQSMNTLINNQNTYSVSSANGLGTVVLNGTLNDILLKTYADSTYNKKSEPISNTQINDGSIPVAKINPNELNQFIADKVATTNCVAHGSFSWLGNDKPHWNLYLGSFDESGEHFMNGLVISAGGNLTNDNKYYHIISNIDFIIQGIRIYSADNLNGPAIPKSELEGK